MKDKKKSLSSLYVLKAVAAFLVVSCHSPFGLIKHDVRPIQCIAVVVFFMISGYFLYNEEASKVISRLKASFLKVLKISIILQLFYLLWVFPNHGLMVHDFNDLLQIIFLGNLTSGHLWYLTAFWEALLILYLIFRLKIAERLMPFLALSLGLLPFLSYYSFLAIAIPKTYLYSVFIYGLPSIAVGYLIRRYEANLLKFKAWGYVVLLSLVLGFLEDYLLIRFAGSTCHDGIFLSSPFFAIGLFMFLLQRKSWGAGSFIETIGKEHSANIYYFHIAVLTICIKFCYALSLDAVIENFGVIICFIISLIVSMLFVRFEKVIGLKLLS